MAPKFFLQEQRQRPWIMPFVWVRPYGSPIASTLEKKPPQHQNCARCIIKPLSTLAISKCQLLPHNTKRDIMYFVSQRHEDKEYNVENEQAFDLPYLIQNVAILY